MHDEPAERSVLGALMMAERDSSAAAEIVVTLDARDFHRGAHRTLFEALRDLRSRRSPCDPLTVADHLDRAGHLADVGGHPALADLVTQSPPAAVAAGHARRVADLAQRRRVAEASAQLASRMGDLSADVDSCVADLVTAAQSRPGAGLHSGAELVEEILDVEDGPLGWAPPWQSLERVWRVVPGWVHVVTGFPSAGKSAWVDALVVGLAEDHGLNVALWAPESAPRRRHARRLAKIRAGWEACDPGDLVESATWVAERMTWIDHDDAQTLPAILARAATVSPACQVLVVDPFTDVAKWDARADEGWDRMLERQLTRLRQWARSRETAVIVVAHPKGIARDKDTRRYPVATISDLHGGAVWRNKVDSCVSVWRDDVSQGSRACEVKVFVQKVREQPAGGEMGRAAKLLRRADRGGRYFPVLQTVGEAM